MSAVCTRRPSPRVLVVPFSVATILFLFMLPYRPLLACINTKVPFDNKGGLAPPTEPMPIKAEPKHPIYKPTPSPKPLVTDNFPLADAARSPNDLPPVPSWNIPPIPHVKERTPLFIGFTRNWLLLQQTIVSYITSGWPPEDIYVIENTGTMNANRLGSLTLQNPFYLDYRRLTDVFGVNVISTPTLLTFAQLQNFYLHTALEKGWDFYFWGHMDVVALCNEDWHDPEDGEYKSMYRRCVADLRQTLVTGSIPDDKGRAGGWAIKFYAYDRLALVNRSSFEQVGGWDTMIPYYGTDCDMHTRLSMASFKQADAHVGMVFDIGHSLENLEVLYRRSPREPIGPRANNEAASSPPALTLHQPEDHRGSQEYARLRDTLNSMQVNKNSGNRNLWQSVQEGGLGEPYYKDPRGFETAIAMWMNKGQDIMAEKWGHRGCNLIAQGLGLHDAWRVEHDW